MKARLLSIDAWRYIDYLKTIRARDGAAFGARTMKVRILNIDAWRYDDGWTWNNWYPAFPHAWVEIPDNITNRQLLRLAREEWGILSDQSKGRVTVEDDGYNLVILDRKTLEPLYAVEYGSFE